MRDVPDNTVLLLKPILHLFVDVSPVLRKFTQRVRFNPLYLLPLPAKLGLKLVNKFALHLLSFSLFLQDSFLDLFGIGSKVVQNHAFINDSLVALFVKTRVKLRDVAIDRSQLVI